MKLMTISEVTKTFSISTRMLRYYDEIGLLPSIRKDDYAYRVYDEPAIKRLQQIITLRKLRIPLKKIASIFDNTEQAKVVEVFQESLEELDDEVAALQTIRDILRIFVLRLNLAAQTQLHLDILDDDELTRVVQLLSLSKMKLKEEHSMEDLNKASETLSTLKNVRILYLPPCTVAASHYFGENPEDGASEPFNRFVRNIGLPKLKPDFRVFGFNNPSPKANETYGYEFWATIPDDLEVPAPLVKKHFAGGLYAAHCIKMGDFHEWPLLGNWVRRNPEYLYDAREPLGMGGCLEEHLNAYSYYLSDESTAKIVQLDLLSPVKLR